MEDEWPCGHTRRITIGGQCGECTTRQPKQPTPDMTMPPEQWERAYGVMVRDPDGWRGDGGRGFDEPVTIVEFWRRARTSTVDAANPAWEGVARGARLCRQSGEV